MTVRRSRARRPSCATHGPNRSPDRLREGLNVRLSRMPEAVALVRVPPAARLANAHRIASRPLSPLAIPRSHVVGTLDTWTSNVGTLSTWTSNVGTSTFRTVHHDDVTGGLSRGEFVRRSSAG